MSIHGGTDPLSLLATLNALLRAAILLSTITYCKRAVTYVLRRVAGLWSIPINVLDQIARLMKCVIHQAYARPIVNLRLVKFICTDHRICHLVVMPVMQTASLFFPTLGLVSMVHMVAVARSALLTTAIAPI